MLEPDSFGSSVIAAGRGSTSGADEATFKPPSALITTTTTNIDMIMTAPIPESTTTEVLLGPVPFSSTDEGANISSNPSAPAFLPAGTASSLDDFVVRSGNFSEMNDFFDLGEASLCGSSRSKTKESESTSPGRVGVVFSSSLAASKKLSRIGLFSSNPSVGRSLRSSFALTSDDSGEVSTPLKN